MTTRRAVLQGLPASVLAACEGERTYAPAREEPDADWPGLGDADDALFPDGVQSGEPRVSGLRLWTRYTGDAALDVVVVRWDGTAWVDVGTIAATPADGGFVHVPVEDLPADAPIAYQFRDATGALSRIGHSRTAADAGSARTIRFGAVSCCSPLGVPYLSLTNAAARGPMDFFVWNGDTVYQDGAETADEFRGRWAANLQTDGFRAVMSRAPGLFTWDDHEVGDAWGVPTAPDVPTDAQVVLGKTTFFEVAPVAPEPADPQRLWRQYRFGAVEVFVLDGRTGHDVDAGRYLSEEQFQWLLDGLSASTATWKVIVNSVPITQMPAAYDVQYLLYEHWTGYAQRGALIEHITGQSIPGVMFVGGDFHHPGLYRVDAEGPGSRLLEFLVGPAGSRLNPLGRVIMDGAQYVWSDAVHNATRFELRPEGLGHAMWVADDDRVVAEVWFDVHGEILFLDWIVPPS